MAEGRGTHFDADIYEAFLRALPEIRSIRKKIRDRRDEK